MQIVRTLFWIALLALLLLFSYFNWNPVEVRIWENLLVETKVPALVIVSFLLGLLPMWMYHRGIRWSLSRKIVSLENAARASVAPPGGERAHVPAPSPVPTPAPTPAPASSPVPEQKESPDLKPEGQTK